MSTRRSLHRIVQVACVAILLCGCSHVEPKYFESAYGNALTCSTKGDDTVFRTLGFTSDPCPSAQSDADQPGGDTSKSTTNVSESKTNNGKVETDETTTTTSISISHSIAPTDKPPATNPPQTQAAKTLHLVKACPDDTVPYASASSSSANSLSSTSTAGAASASDASASTSSHPKYSPCETSIIQAAVNYCVARTMSSDFKDELFEWASGGTTILSGLIAGGIAAATGASAPVSVTIAAAAGTISTSGTSFQKLLPTGTATVSIPSLISAADAYIQLTGGMLTISGAIPLADWKNPSENDPTKIDLHYRYYAGLWNAVGSACPPNVFRAVVNYKVPDKN